MSVSSVQMAYRLARAASGVNTASTTHKKRGQTDPGYEMKFR